MFSFNLLRACSAAPPDFRSFCPVPASFDAPRPPPYFSAVPDTPSSHRPLLIAVLALVGLTTIALVLVLVFARPVAERLAARRNTPPAANPEPSAHGEIVATKLFIGADDFVVDLFHNGQRVPDTARQMTTEVYGAIGERVDITVRERDWVVFNVVNNRLRWGGAYYFGVAGVNDDCC